MSVPMTRMAIAVLAAVGLMVGGQHVLAGDVPDVPAQVAGLEVAPPEATDRYDRDEFGYSWPDLDRDCLDTRHEVLLRDLDDPVVVDCKVQSGLFRDPYTGVSGQAIASSLDVDHVVSLADAWQSGAHGWSDARRFAFANDLENLLATNDTANRCKSDKGPAEWDEPPVVGDRVCDRQRAPQDPQLRCGYARSYVATKTRWGLSVTEADRQVLVGMLAQCPVGAL